MKRIVIIGATSGIGLDVARLCIREGWQVGTAGRREVIDRRYAIFVFFWKLIPQWLWERLKIRTKE